MTESTQRNERTRYQIELEIRYGMRLDELHRRFYARLASALTFALLLAGSAAFGGYIAALPELAGAAGLVVAALTLAEVVLRPGERGAYASALARQFGVLRATAGELTIDDLSRRLSELQCETLPGEIEALRGVAMNDVLREHGHSDELLALSRWQRVIAVLA